MKFATLLTAVLCVAPVAAQESSGAMRIKGADARLIKDVRVLAQRIEAMRAEEFRRTPIAVRAPEDLRHVAAEIRAYDSISAARLAARGRAWSDVGLGDASSPTTVLLTLAADLAGIGFDPAGNRLLVAPEKLGDEDFEPQQSLGEGATILMLTGVRKDEPLFAHYLMHVRQRERTGGDSLAPTTDEMLARGAWAEGEANLIAVRYLFEGLGLQDEVLELSTDPRDFLEGALFPPALQDLPPVEAALVEFVYSEGFAQAARSYLEGGWSALDRGIGLAATSHNVLHGWSEPRQPVSIEAPDPPRAGFELADEDVLGEQGIIVLLATLTGKDNLALQGADGWAGDRLYRWEDPSSGAGITEWVLRWVSEAKAGDFDYAYGRALQARYGTALEPRGEGRWELTAGDLVLRVERRGASVRVWVGPRELLPTTGENEEDPGPS